MSPLFEYQKDLELVALLKHIDGINFSFIFNQKIKKFVCVVTDKKKFKNEVFIEKNYQKIIHEVTEYLKNNFKIN